MIWRLTRANQLKTDQSGTEIHKLKTAMPGQLDNLKSRKRKSSSQVAAVGRSLKIQRKRSPAEQGLVLRSGTVMDLRGSRSLIICECELSSNRGRCSSSPELEGQEGKENELMTEREMDSCRANGGCDKSKHMDCEETLKISFPDDDSNQILPVEQFFGNLDVVQDFPQKTTSIPDVKKENRRRQFYAREESEEEAGLTAVRPDREEDT